MQIIPELPGLTARTLGEHADRAHTDHDLAGWADDAGNFDPTPGEAAVNVLQLPVSQRLRAGLLTWLTIMNCG